MTVYISRDEAIEICYAPDIDRDYPRMDIASRLHDLPAVNVRPVVLCRDCGHWNKNNQHPCKMGRNVVAMCAWFSRNYGTIETSEGDWCSYGYRREES